MGGNGGWQHFAKRLHMNRSQPQYLLVVADMMPSIRSAVMTLRRRTAYKHLSIVLLTHRVKKAAAYEHDPLVHIVPFNFNDTATVEGALKPYLAYVVGVVCRGDRNVQYLRQILPLLPAAVPVATADALACATNKHLMREAFAKHAPEITPRFMIVEDASATTLDAIEAAMQYPIIIKPSNLASSLLVQHCSTRAETKRALEQTFAHIADIYRREERTTTPKVLAEEYLEGDCYSVDAYILPDGKVYCCPPVAYMPAKQLGIDDFFIYKRHTPVTTLSPREERAAYRAVEAAIRAIELRASSAHVELIRTRDGWRVIELGPRLGNFRHQMYQQCYGINHALNDVKVRLGLRPRIPRRVKKYAVGYNIYPAHEGKLRRIHGLDWLGQQSEVLKLHIMAHPGDFCASAKSGGRAPLTVLFVANTKDRIQELMRGVETGVGIDVWN
jgi:D-alanine-D-alanine ligase-like ATP-grasp enzyme